MEDYLRNNPVSGNEEQEFESWNDIIEETIEDIEGDSIVDLNDLIGCLLDYCWVEGIDYTFEFDNKPTDILLELLSLIENEDMDLFGNFISENKDQINAEADGLIYEVNMYDDTIAGLKFQNGKKFKVCYEMSEYLSENEDVDIDEDGMPEFTKEMVLIMFEEDGEKC